MENNNTLSNNVDLKQAMNIPDYDPVKYPKLNDEDMMRAGLFCYQLSLVGSAVDKNLQNLLWHVYLQMSNYIKGEGTGDIVKALDNLKEYIKISNNPMFKTLKESIKD